MFNSFNIEKLLASEFAITAPLLPAAHSCCGALVRCALRNRVEDDTLRRARFDSRLSNSCLQPRRGTDLVPVAALVQDPARAYGPARLMESGLVLERIGMHQTLKKTAPEFVATVVQSLRTV